TVGLDAGGPVNIATWRSELDGWPYATRVVALTTLMFDVETGEMVDADMEFNSIDFTFSTDDSPDTYDLQQSVTHEVGHMLCLGHSNAPEAVMYMTAGPGALQKRHLSADDIEGVMANHGLAGAPPTQPCGDEDPLGTLEEPHCPDPTEPSGCTGGRDGTGSTLWVLCAALLCVYFRRIRWTALVATACLVMVSGWMSTAAWGQMCKPYIAANGEPIYWPVGQVELSIDPGLPTTISTDEMLDATHGGLDAWASNPCVEMAVDFRDEGDGFAPCPGEGIDDGLHCIYWVLPDDTWLFGEGLIAVTLVHHNPETAEIVDTDMAFNGTGAFSWSSPEVCDPDSPDHDLLATFTHEFGHFFGLNHSGFAQSTMDGSTRPGDCGKRSLHDMDQECLCDTLATVPGPVEPGADASGGDGDSSTGGSDGHDAGSGDTQSAPPAGGCQGYRTSDSGTGLPLILVSFVCLAIRRQRPTPRAVRAR
ncbi:MAG: matrixin family metalloprotease, partial [Myxococcota bacterium]|nr:matrixin family metalloprotease [Myxococcota bacterium]